MKKYSDSDDDASDGSFSEASVASASNELTSSKGTDPSTPRQPMRDEVQEIEKASMNDTKWIRRWRLLLIFMLIATAATVTLVTFLFLEEEQDNNYKASVCHASRVFRHVQSIKGLLASKCCKTLKWLSFSLLHTHTLNVSTVCKVQ